MPQITGMRGTSSFTNERSGDFNQRLKDLGKNKKKKKPQLFEGQEKIKGSGASGNGSIFI